MPSTRRVSIGSITNTTAVPFTYGLFRICRQQPNPWLALVVATPFLIIVVGMGYTRQAAAMGFLMIGRIFHAAIQDVGEGIKVATVADPFGNHLGLIENPHFDPNAVK